MRVLIFGCGPAGLMAAHAAVIHAHEVIIVSKNRKSHMRGAQYLHAPIPFATRSGPFPVTYSLKGTASDYRLKVYGESFRGTVSPEDLTESHDAYDIRQTYDFLWESYNTAIQDDDLSSDPDKIDKVMEWAKPNLCISTIPAPLLCRRIHHGFTKQEIWSNDMDIAQLPENTVVCNGEVAPAWYRAARIQGHTTVEWPENSKPPIPVTSVTKPISNTCDCYPEIVRMGRYGRWEKGVLSHSAFDESVDIFEGMEVVTK